MDKEVSVVDSKEHEIILKNRKSMLISGVKNVDSFDSEEFLIDSELGHIHIKGSELVLEKMDLDNGKVTIKGKIDSFNYVNGQKNKANKENFVKKLFK